MIATINNFQVDLSKPIDISIPLSYTDANPIAWYIESQKLNLYVLRLIESVFRDVIHQFQYSFNPHGHGTHTECLGISPEILQRQPILKQFFYC
jgi:hypothetical protein